MKSKSKLDTNEDFLLTDATKSLVSPNVSKPILCLMFTMRLLLRCLWLASVAGCGAFMTFADSYVSLVYV
jgi:hypothetical protein